jgi:hypothetical protein
MSETDSPAQGSGNDTALTIDAGAAAIEGLLSSVPEQAEANQDSATNEESQNTENEGAQANDDNASQEAPDEGDDGLEFDDETTDAAADAPKEPEFKAGQFAAHDAKVKLDDGSTISVSELIAGNMFQRTFTQKTTALSEEKKAFEAERSQFAETKQQIEQQRNIILTLAQELIPQEPQPVDPDQDMVGYINYLAQRDAYLGKMAKLQYLWNSTQQEQSQLTAKQQKEQEEFQRQQQERYQSRLQTEQQKLFEVIPALKDDARRAAFIKDAVKIGGDVYGITPEEIQAISDHRYMRALYDAIAFRKAVAKRDNGKQAQVPAQQAPQPRIQQRQRMATQAPEVRDSNSAAERLRKTGSREDAVKALMKFV